MQCISYIWTCVFVWLISQFRYFDLHTSLAMCTAVLYCTCEERLFPYCFFLKSFVIHAGKNLPPLNKLYDVHCMLIAPAYFPPEAFKSAQASNSSRGSPRLCWCMSDWMLGWLTCCPISSSWASTESRSFCRHLAAADRKRFFHCTFCKTKLACMTLLFGREYD